MSTTLASPPSSPPRASLHMSAKGKVDTCASSARGVGTFQWISAIFFGATTIRLLQFIVEALLAGSPGPLDAVFGALAALSSALCVRQLRAQRH